MILNYNNKPYAFNLDKILNFYQSGEKNRETEIVDMYEMDEDDTPKVISKQTREVKNNQPTQNENIRYDLIKMFVDRVLEANSVTAETLDLGTSLAFNTMLCDGFIYEITE